MPADATASLIFTNGRVHTVHARDSIAEAVAVQGQRILAVGSNAEIRAYAGAGTQDIDLRGRSLLPGFIDAHCHLVGLGAGVNAIDCKAPGMTSIAALVEEVRRRAQSLPPGAWIRGTGYDQTKLAEQRHPNRFDFDAAAPDHPVVFTRTCGHIIAANSRALALAGITDTTPDPDGGRYDREGGRILGVCYEQATIPVRAVSGLTPIEIRESILKSQADYLAAGATSVHDAGGFIGQPFVEALELLDAGMLKLRIYAFGTDGFGGGPGTNLVSTGIHTGFGNDRLQVGAYKVVTDGSTSGPTAATRDPYASNSDDSGILYWSQSQLDSMIERAHRAGFQVTMHAVGDRAISNGLDAIANAMHVFPRQDLRHRIEHCAILPPDLRQRVKALGIVPAMQPAFFWEFGDGYNVNYGRERAGMMFPTRSLIEMGVVVAGSSDSPVTDYRPLFGIEQAQTRATMNGDHCNTDECVDLATAIRMHTFNGAYASFAEEKKGSIEPGKLADLTVLSDDITRVPTKGLRDLPVDMTFVEGELVHERH